MVKPYRRCRRGPDHRPSAPRNRFTRRQGVSAEQSRRVAGCYRTPRHYTGHVIRQLFPYSFFRVCLVVAPVWPARGAINQTLIEFSLGDTFTTTIVANALMHDLQEFRFLQPECKIGIVVPDEIRHITFRKLNHIGDDPSLKVDANNENELVITGDLQSFHNGRYPAFERVVLSLLLRSALSPAPTVVTDQPAILPLH